MAEGPKRNISIYKKIYEMLDLYVSNGILPDQIDLIFNNALEKNSKIFFYMVMITLQRFREKITRERLQRYEQECIKNGEEFYLKQVRSLYKFLYNESEFMDIFDQPDENGEPFLIMGDDIENI